MPIEQKLALELHRTNRISVSYVLCIYFIPSNTLVVLIYPLFALHMSTLFLLTRQEGVLICLHLLIAEKSVAKSVSPGSLQFHLLLVVLLPQGGKKGSWQEELPDKPRQKNERTELVTFKCSSKKICESKHWKHTTVLFLMDYFDRVWV